MILSAIIILVIALVYFNPKASNNSWDKANRDSANLVAPAAEDIEAKVQIYTAQAYSWRGKFSQHTWIATKEKNADSYLVHFVVLWGRYFGADGVVVTQKDLPDRRWFDAQPKIIFSASGQEAEKLIPQIYDGIKKYPYQKLYRAYPGPNSNTFVSFVIRNVPDLKIALPSNAIGKDWLCDEKGVKFFAFSESKTGVQFSFYGIFGLIIGLIEGIEINILGLSFGIDFLHPAIKLPAIGRLGIF
ncbi:MAG: DUF3750 domain-containing protein [Rickettsiales bacterium]|nr:DUF3750 domain-containing protein [Rickettsiales bacterium]